MDTLIRVVVLLAFLFVSNDGFKSTYYHRHISQTTTSCQSPFTVLASTKGANTESFQRKATKAIKGVVSIPLTAIDIMKESLYVAADATPTVLETIREIPNTINQTVSSIGKPPLSELPLGGLLKAERESIEKRQRLQKYLPKYVIGNWLSSIRDVIDRFYEILDKMTSKDKSDSAPVVISPRRRKSSNSLLESFESAKETYYTVVDGVKSTIETTQNIATTTVSITQNVITTVQELPQTIEATQENLQQKRERLLEDIEQLQVNSVETAKVVKKIVTLEAAKETAERVQTKITSVQRGIDGFKAKIQSLTSPSTSVSVSQSVSTTSAVKPLTKEKKKKSNIIDNIKVAYGVASTVASGVVVVVSGASSFLKWATSKRVDRVGSSSQSLSPSPSDSSAVSAGRVASVTSALPSMDSTLMASESSLSTKPTVDVEAAISTSEAKSLVSTVVVEEPPAPEAPQFLWDRLMLEDSSIAASDGDESGAA